MKDVKGLTLQEIAEALALPEKTTHQRIMRAGIEPLFRGALYPLDTLDKIKEVPMGRPPKDKTEPKSNPAKKTKK